MKENRDKNNISNVIKELNLKVVDSPIRSGDLYVAERNNGPKLLECKRNINGIIHPVTNDYAFDEWECIHVEEVKQ